MGGWRGLRGFVSEEELGEKEGELGKERTVGDEWEGFWGRR